MSGHSQALGSLKAIGYRLTPQRVMVLNAIGERKGHICAEEIYDKVCEVYPYIDLATVYRTLQLLKKLHLVTEIDVGSGSAQFELTKKDRHHHMVCSQCGNAFDLSHRYLETFRQALVEEFGFEPDVEHFAISGLCKTCAQKGKTRKD